MKTLLSLLILLTGILPLAYAQNGITWTDPVKISSRTDGNSSFRIEVLENGDPVIVFGQISGRNIKTIRIADGVPQAVSYADKGSFTPTFFSFAGIDLATHNDSLYIVFEAGGKLYLSKSPNAGQTFYPPVLAFDPPDNKIATLSSIAVDEEGNPIISTLWETAAEREARYVTVYSDNGGESFLPFVNANEPAEGDYVCECCPSDIFMEGEEVYLAYRNNPGNRRDIWVSRSLNKAMDYQEATDVDETDWNISFCPISKPSLLSYSSDTVLVAFHSGASGKGRVYLNYLDRTNLGAGTSFEFPLTSANGSQNSPVLAGSGDTLGMVWVENGFSGTGADLMFALSKHGRIGLQENFGKIMDLNKNQELPELAYHEGFFHLVFADIDGLWYQKGIVDNSTSLPLLSKGNFTIFPQPVRGNTFTVELENALQPDANIQLFSLEGKLIQSWSGLSRESLALQILRPLKGSFVLKINQGGRYSSHPIIFQ